LDIVTITRLELKFSKSDWDDAIEDKLNDDEIIVHQIEQLVSRKRELIFGYSYYYQT